MGAPLRHEDVTAGESTATIKTLVVTDLVDSTRLLATIGDRRAAELSARHERVARDLLLRCGGREIDKTDGFLLVFERTVDAVRFALAYHRELAALSSEVGQELAARVGIHLGEVILRANTPEDVARGAKPVEIEGYAKPIAARVMALAEARQTLLTRGAFDLARQAAAREPVAAGELRWLAHGPYVLKGVTEPVEVFEVGEKDFAPLLVPKSTAKARRAVSAAEELTLGWRPAPGLEIPRRARWRLVEKLGEGGFGEVWLGRHEKTRENRVFKFCYQPDRLRSLQREVTLFRLLKETLGSRDDIARILDWNFDEAPYFLECEYTEGGNLVEWVHDRGGPAAVPLETRLELMAQVADALAAAHSVGVLHKDVKPSNVLVRAGESDRPRVRLTDFGIGLITDREALARQGITVFDLTEMVADSTSSTGGTHLYMAPELVEGRGATVQADIYALGVMLYQFLAEDFSRALAPGWRRDVADEVLQEDIAALVDGRPERRMRDAQRVAERLRTLDERRAKREAERREREEREAERLALERAHRRRRLSAAIAAAALVVLAVVSYLAVQAVEARREAERRRGQAESLIGFMVGDLRGKLEPIGRLDLLDEIGDQALQYFESVPEDQLTDEELFRRSEALYQIGDVRTGTGDLSAARQAYGESRSLAQKLVERSPDNTLWKKSLGASYFGVGSILWRQGDLEGALQQFQEYLRLSEELAAQEPENPDWVLEKAYGLSNVGSVAQALGDLERARGAFEQSLELREKLVSSSPGNLKWRYDLAVAHNKLGVVLDSIGNREAASEHFREDLELTEEVLAEEPANADFRHHRATAQSFFGDLLLKSGEPAEASRYFEAAWEGFSDLSASDPSNVRWRRNLATVGQSLGNVQLALGAPERALGYLTTAEQSLAQLADEAPMDSRLARVLAKTRLDLGTTLLRLERIDEARLLIVSVLKTAAAANGTALPGTEDVLLTSNAHRLLGSVYEAEGRSSMARKEWRAAAALVQPLADSTADSELLTAWVIPKLLLGERDDVDAALKRLVTLGHRDPELMELLKSSGISVPRPSPRPPEEGAAVSNHEFTPQGGDHDG